MPKLEVSAAIEHLSKISPGKELGVTKTRHFLLMSVKNVCYGMINKNSDYRTFSHKYMFQLNRVVSFVFSSG